MPLFYYIGRDEKGLRVTGEISAAQANDVADELISQNISPVEIRAGSTRTNYFVFLSSLFKPKLTFSQLGLFCRQMHSLTKAGVPILSAVRRLSDVSSIPALKKTLNEVGYQISLGRPLSTAMQAYPSMFPPLLIALLATGEANGRIDEAFLQASGHYELANTTRKRVKTALRYPLTVVVVAFFAIMGISTFIIPKFASMYERFEATLPLPTRILLNFSAFMRHYWWVLIIAAVLCALLGRMILATERYRILVDRYKFKLPVFGDILKRIMMTSFTRTLAILLKTNVPLIDAIQLVAEVVNNHYAKQKILSLREFIERGDNLAVAAAKVQLFSPLILQMLSVGETTGNMDKMLFEISAFYEQEIDYDIKQLTDKIEPILLIVVGMIVLLLALGIFLPMWNMVYVVH